MVDFDVQIKPAHLVDAVTMQMCEIVHLDNRANRPDESGGDVAHSIRDRNLNLVQDRGMAYCRC